MIDGELLKGTSRMKLDVFSRMHFSSRSLEVGNSDLTRTVAQCGFQIDLVYGIDNNALKLTEDDENVWHSLQPLGFQIEDYMILNSDVEVHRAQSIYQMFG